MELLRVEQVRERLSRYKLQTVSVETGISYMKLYNYAKGAVPSAETLQVLSDYFKNIEQKGAN